MPKRLSCHRAVRQTMDSSVLSLASIREVGVGYREHERPLHAGAHGFDDLLGEGPMRGGGAQQDRRLDVPHGLEQRDRSSAEDQPVTSPGSRAYGFW